MEIINVRGVWFLCLRIGLSFLRIPTGDGVPCCQLLGSIPLFQHPSGNFRSAAFLTCITTTSNSKHRRLLINWENLWLQESGWPWQLLSVTCLSVAAKMEETQVPQLLDLQVMDPAFMFNPPTIMRMELFLMDALMWRMKSITPFDFFDHFAADDHHRNNGITFSTELLTRASDLVLVTHHGNNNWWWFYLLTSCYNIIIS